MAVTVRHAEAHDLPAIRAIYNEGIEEREATLETDRKSVEEIAEWWSQHDGRHRVLVAADLARVVGWASLNRFSHRCAHAGIADVSVYVAREHRGTGVGLALLRRLTDEARANGFHKIVLHALDVNERGKRLYRRAGFSEVGIFREHGRLGDRFVDVIAMELLL